MVVVVVVQTIKCSDIESIDEYAHEGNVSTDERIKSCHRWQYCWVREATWRLRQSV